MSETFIISSILAVYLAILFAIAIWSRSAAGTLEGYYLAGRKLPFWVAAFSANATGESSWLLLGLSGMGYLIGLHAIWIVIGETIGIWLAWRLIAPRLKLAADAQQSITVPDLLEGMLNDTAQRIRITAVVIILAMVAAYVSAQMVATGKIFSNFLPMDYQTGVIFGGVITLAYTAYGGFKAVAYSDVLQGILMLLALVSLPVVAIAAVDGDFWQAVRAADPLLLDVTGNLGWGLPGLIAVISFLSIGFAFMAAPQLLTRFMAIRSSGEIKSAARISVACILAFDLGAVMVGIAGRVLFPDLSDAETVFPTVARELLPAVITGVFLVMVLAAVMSTVDSLLILASSAVVRDLLQKYLRLAWSDSRFAAAGKIVTAIIGVSAIVFALTDTKVIFWFVVFAQTGLASAFGPPVICALFYKGITKAGALAGMIGGFLTSTLWSMYMKPYSYNLIEGIPAMIAGFGLIFLVSRLTRDDKQG
ncbi:MAG: sodium/proline symporter [Gammaproteobacteria bacterium]|nr:sodium/proline symporter [Gammaproteobacteria bacterium]